MESRGCHSFFLTDNEKIEQIQTNDNTLSSVVLYQSTKDDNFFVTLATSLMTNTFVTHLYLKSQPNCSVTINGWKALFQMLQVNKTVLMLVISDCNFNFACAQLFATMVLLHDNNVLTDLFIDGKNQQFGMNGAFVIIDALCANRNGCTVTSLKLCHVVTDDNDNNTMMKNKFAVKLVTLLQHNFIKRLELGRNHLGDDFITTLASELKYNTRLESLNLNGNEITSVGAVALANALYYNKALVELQVSLNTIGDIGAIAITTAVKYHPHLESIGIAWNDLSLDGLVKAMSFLRYNESVKRLYCGDEYCQHDDDDTELKLSREIQSILEYNDVIHYFDACVNAVYANELIEANKHRTRTAPKIGLRRRQDIYTKLCNDFGINQTGRSSANN